MDVLIDRNNHFTMQRYIKTLNIQLYLNKADIIPQLHLNRAEKKNKMQVHEKQEKVKICFTEENLVNN